MGQAEPKSLAFTGYFLAVVATVIWAGNFIVGRVFYMDILPVALAFWRWTIAVVTLMPFAMRTTIDHWKLVKKHLPYLSVSALLGVTAFNTSIYIAGYTSNEPGINCCFFPHFDRAHVSSLLRRADLLDTRHGYGGYREWCRIVNYGRLLRETAEHFLRNRLPQMFNPWRKTQKVK
ncbi:MULTISPECIES: DMT family transporter [Nostocales]|uniref:DMT family transporter n=3 Tax=Nostocales TaxID=1161 RepID=A0A8S9SX62_9CYAN|nr:DMT family transporter [Tolypothrix bouteillei]KAF3884438.1 DMT family transporter [Tolypothrix bouteillei VB521301]